MFDPRYALKYNLHLQYNINPIFDRVKNLRL